MAYLGSWKIDDFITFCCNTHDPDTGVATDADAVPAYRVYEDETGAAITNGNMALLDAANTTGFYSERLQLLAATGFEKGKHYTIYISATVDTDTGTMHHNLQIEAEVDANTASGLHADLVDGGRLDLLIDAIKAVTDALPDAGALNDLGTVLTDTDELQGDWTDGGRLDLLIDAIKAVTDALPDAGALNDLGTVLTDTDELQGDWTDGGRLDLLIDAIKAVTDALNDPTAIAIADEVLKRGVANVEDAADTTSLAALVLAAFESALVGGVWTIRKTGGAAFVVKAATLDAGALPITGVT